MHFDGDKTLKQLKQFADDLFAEELSIKQFSRSEVEQSVTEFYELMKLPRPQFVWLQNPWQVLFAPGLITQYKRQQIRIETIQSSVVTAFLNSVRNQLGEECFFTLSMLFTSQIPLNDITALSRLISLEFDLVQVDMDRTQRHPRHSRALVDRMRSLVLDNEQAPRIEPHLLDRVSTNVSWYALAHFLDEKPPWKHISVQTGFALDAAELGLLWGGELRAPAASATPPPGIEWSHYLRMQNGLAVFARRYMQASLSQAEDHILDVFERLSRVVHVIACFPQICFVCEPPLELHRDPQNRFHNESGPAISYGDGFDLHFWHNTRIRPDAIESAVTVDKIVHESNAEVARVMIERYGVENYIRDAGAALVHEDETGALYSLGTPHEALRVVAVKNATPEVDGSFKSYYLRVPPNMRTARQAVAWTFHLGANEYEPTTET